VRRASALLAILIGALALVPGADGDRNAFRAAVSYWAMRHTFYDQRSGRYRESERSAAAARAWPYSQALAATIAMTTVPKRGRLYVRAAAQRISGLRLYRRGDGAYAAQAGPTGDVYYDDNEWIALALLRWYELHHDPPALAEAERVFGLVVKAWDSDPGHPCPGGIFWTDARGNQDRNTVTTATGALLGLELYSVTHDPAQLVWSKQMLAWVSQCMLAPDGLLWDHLTLDGKLDQSHWSYNQGTAIGANVLLYRLTSDAAALQRAENLAERSLAYFDRTPDGREPPFFLAIFFENLIELAAVDGNSTYRAEAQRYADGVWDRVRDARTGLFRFDGTRSVGLLEQAAMVRIYASLATGDR
jgi:uncharacterized protein YyaL (SSP411 family)